MSVSFPEPEGDIFKCLVLSHPQPKIQKYSVCMDIKQRKAAIFAWITTQVMIRIVADSFSVDQLTRLIVSNLLQSTSQSQKPDNPDCADGMKSQSLGNSTDRFILSLDEWVTELRDGVLEAWDSMVLWFHWFKHTQTHNMSHPGLEQTRTKRYKSTHTQRERDGLVGTNQMRKSTLLGGFSGRHSYWNNLIWLTTNTKKLIYMFYSWKWA